MTDILRLAEQRLLMPTGLTHRDLESVLSRMMGHHIDGGDIYFQKMHHEQYTLEDGIVKEADLGFEQGVGIRAISAEKTGFAYSDDMVLPALLQAATAARSIAHTGKKTHIQGFSTVKAPVLYSPDDPLRSMTAHQKIAVLRKVDTLARAEDSRVKQVIVSLGGTYETILVMGIDGTLSADIRPLVRLNVSVVVEEQGKRETGSMGGGGRGGYQVFFTEEKLQHYAKEAVRMALVNLSAVEAPAGPMMVVLGSGWPGVLLHEAVGHGLEGDFNRKGSSTFSGRIGERVASPLCTVVDDGTLMERRGSLSIDDEGTPTRRNVLIENGILKGYLQDKLNAKLMGVQSTGSGRRESYAHTTMPRMTNTFLMPGESTPEEIIRSVQKGLYAVHFGGGQVDITSGKFVFSASEAYLIENGKVTRPVKGATLIGNGPDIMNKISMVGNDLALDSGIGTCGKEGQSVPVGVGQPTLRIDEITVGGTQA